MNCGGASRKTSRLRNGRALSGELSGLFEGVRELECGEVLVVAANDLYADGKAFGREAGGYRGGGIAGGRDIPAGLHPIDVVRQTYSGDGSGVGCVDIEGRDLSGR